METRQGLWQGDAHRPLEALDAKESAQADGGEKGKPATGLVISRAKDAR